MVTNLKKQMVYVPEPDHQPLIEVAELTITYANGEVEAVKDVSFGIALGEAYGLIGESGSGKSTIAFSMLGYLSGGTVRKGTIRFNDIELTKAGPEQWQRLRGSQIAIVYQDPMSALNPALKIGEQIAEVLRYHWQLSPVEAWARSVDLLKQVELPDPAGMAHRYPHQLSGGQQQRVVIAMAIACDPKLLILDEPTTGLDVTTEAVILDLINELRTRLKMSVLFISHNLAVVSKVCDRVGVLYAGELVEEGPCLTVLRSPAHAYTKRLLAALPSTAFNQRIALEEVASPHPSVEKSPAKADEKPILRIENVHYSYAQRRRFPFFSAGKAAKAVDGVSLTLNRGETLGIVGESGSGKSTLARILIGLIAPSSGTILFDGTHVPSRAERRGRILQQRIQMIFQNPDGCLNPQQTIVQIVGRPMRLYGLVRRKEVRARVLGLLQSVRLGEKYLERFPRQLSGGEKQRVGIARVLASNPGVVICDEPTSALDVSVQASVLSNLQELQRDLGLSYVFISHDLGVVSQMADRVAVMYKGKIVETGPPHEVFGSPQHPYTKSLVAALPIIEELS